MKMFIKTVEASKIISKCLHYSVIVTLLVAICTGFIGAIAAQKLLLAFDGNCILSVKVFYASVDNGTAIIPQPMVPSTTAIPTENVTTTTTETYTTTTVLPTLETSKDSTRENYAHIYRVLGKKKDPNVAMPKPRVLQVAGIPVDTESDVHHLSTTKIDVHRTHWGHYSRCEYFVFYPLFTGIVGILWGTMIIMFRGKGPDEFDWGIPKPWRIVLPSIVIFTLMTAFTLAYIIYMETLKKEFCNMLRVNLTTDMKCGDLLQSYQLHIPEGFSTRMNYDLSTLMPRINISSWVLALLIMLARFFFAIDFQLVKVTVSTYKEDAASSSGSSASKDELEENVIRLHDDTKSTADFEKKSSRFSSKDDLEDFESAISDTEMTTFTNSAPSSLEPLLHYKSTPTRVLNTGGM